jgi:hypothetical protein
MIKVGIHENILFHKVTKNDRGSLVVGIKIVDTNPLASLDTSSDNSAGEAPENDFLFFPPQATAKDGNTDTADNNMEKVKQLKDQLSHILLGFMTADKIKWDTTKDTGITSENFNQKMTQQPVLDVMYNNIVTQFTKMITPYLNNPKYLFRILLTRQSKAKHFPALRKRYLGEQPFLESMSIPKDQSRLKYTPWELTNRFDSPEKVEEATPIDSEAASVADEFFKG